MYEFAVATTVLVIVALWPLSQLKGVIQGKADEPRRLAVSLDPGASVVPVLAAIEENGYGIDSVDVGEGDEERSLDIVFTTTGDASLGGLIDDVGGLEGVRSASVAD
jgi:hypothetical protein